MRLLPLIRACCAAGLLAGTAAAEPSRPGLQPCRVDGIAHAALCGSVSRPLDPAQPGGTRIDVHYAVLPALARHPLPDPVVFFAGGPGQSAIALAGTVSATLARLAIRRDIVLIDQRGTGRSAPLSCGEPPPARPLADAVDPARQAARLRDCRESLSRLPHGDLRHYTTTAAAGDADAVRRALGAERVNLIGASYGTRVALEVLRLHPRTVRRAVLDGVAPADMVLPAAFSLDNQAALDAVFDACDADAACRRRHPALRADWRRLLASLPRPVTVPHPFTGEPQSFTLTRDALLGLLRAPLYVPVLASALPMAIDAAARGRWEPLVGLATATGGARRAGAIAEGMHFAVVCAEDAPRLDAARDAPGADFGDAFSALYRRACDGWPSAPVDPAFYTLPPAPAPTLLLSGGADPATPPRHAARVAAALGPLARHVVVPNAGHGTMALPCLRDVVHRFVDADDDADALRVDAACAASVPRPPVYVPLAAAGVGASR